MVARCAVTKLTKAEPTLPHPSTPIRTSLVTGGRLRAGPSPQKPFAVAELRLAAGDQRGDGTTADQDCGDENATHTCTRPGQAGGRRRRRRWDRMSRGEA